MTKINQRLEKLLSHPLLLKAMAQTASTMIGFKSQRKAWLNQALGSGWKALQLPNRRDQERTLQLISELHHRIAELEAKNRVEAVRDTGRAFIAPTSLTRGIPGNAARRTNVVSL